MKVFIVSQFQGLWWVDTWPCCSLGEAHHLAEGHGEAKLLAYLMTAREKERGREGLKRDKTTLRRHTCPSDPLSPAKSHFLAVHPAVSSSTEDPWVKLRPL